MNAGMWEKGEAFTAAVAELLKKADARPYPIRLWYRITSIGYAPIDRRYIFQFTKLGSLDGVLQCCGTLGISKEEVRAIHALIYG